MKCVRRWRWTITYVCMYVSYTYTVRMFDYLCTVTYCMSGLDCVLLNNMESWIHRTMVPLCCAGGMYLIVCMHHCSTRFVWPVLVQLFPSSNPSARRKSWLARWPRWAAVRVHSRCMRDCICGKTPSSATKRWGGMPRWSGRSQQWQSMLVSYHSHSIISPYSAQ